MHLVLLEWPVGYLKLASNSAANIDNTLFDGGGGVGVVAEKS